MSTESNIVCTFTSSLFSRFGEETFVRSALLLLYACAFNHEIARTRATTC